MPGVSAIAEFDSNLAGDRDTRRTPCGCCPGVGKDSRGRKLRWYCRASRCGRCRSPCRHGECDQQSRRRADGPAAQGDDTTATHGGEHDPRTDPVENQRAANKDARAGAGCPKGSASHRPRASAFAGRDESERAGSVAPISPPSPQNAGSSPGERQSEVGTRNGNKGRIETSGTRD